VSIEVSSDAVAAYLDAVQDANGIYRELGLAPPLGVAAAALGALLELLELPAGTLHTGQEIEMRGGVPMGCTCAVRGRIAQRSERAGLVIAALEFEITLAGSREPALVGRTTVMMPKGAGP
jgi:hypothetical protein